MKTLLSTVAAAALALTARADMTITQKMTQSGNEGSPTIPEMTLVMKFKGQKMRVDGMPQMSTFVDLDDGEVTSLIHPQKAYVVIPASANKAMLEARKGTLPPAEVPKATGRKETINGFACEEYETNVGTTRMQFWLTKDLPAAEKLMTEMSSFAGVSNPIDDVMKANNITGFPMKTTITIPGKGSTTMTVVSLNEDPIPDTEFVLPKDYRKMDIPKMPGQ